MTLRKHAAGAIALLIALFVSGAAVASAPFGFDPNTHPNEYGFCSPTETEDIYRCTNAPKPHGKFQWYKLFYMEGIGLCKTTGVGHIIDNDSYGMEIRRAADKIAKQIARRYGEATNRFDFIMNDSIWDEPNEWMRSVSREERYYSYFWSENDGYKPVNGIISIGVQVRGLNGSAGYVRVVFDFGVIPRCVRATDDAESDVF